MSSLKIESDWILLDEAKPNARMRLFCFPYAGGGASLYKNWNDWFSDNIEVFPVQLPGRENRLAESAFDDIYSLVETLFIELSPWFNKDFAFVGHCMGAKILFELTRKLSKQNCMPQLIIVSGCEAPHIEERFKFYNLSDEDFVDGLRKFGGTSEIVLNNKELMHYFLPKFRKDFHLSDTYIAKENTPINCPIIALYGTRDLKAGKNNVMMWKNYTKKRFSMYEFEGDHFFIRNAQEEILPILQKKLNAVLYQQSSNPSLT